MNKQLPTGWEIRKSKAGKIFYKNTINGSTQWDLPTEPAEGIEDVLPPGWFKKTSSTTGKIYYYNVKLNKTLWEQPVLGDIALLSKDFLSPGWVETKSRTTGKIYYYNVNLNKSQWERPVLSITGGPGCPNLRGLKWIGNSCYLDSALLSFFAVPTEFTDKLINMDLRKNRLPKFAKNIFNCGSNAEEDLANRQLVQKQLGRIAKSIRGTGSFVEYCSDLRETLKACPDPENYHGTGMADSGEFLTYILSLFPLDIAQEKRISYATNDIDNVIGEIPPENLIAIGESYNCNTNIMQFVDSNILKSSKDNVNISSFLKIVIDSGELTNDNLYKYKPSEEADEQLFSRTISITTLEYTPYLIFNIKRIGINYETGDDVFIRKPITPEPEITLPNGQRFALSAVVMYTGKNHYVSTLRCGELWYYYDDTNYRQLQEMGTYEDVVRRALHNPNTNGTQYYYTPIGKVSDPPICLQR